MNPVLIMQILAVAIDLVQKGTLTYLMIRKTLEAGMASDAQLAELDARYDAAIAARDEAHPPPPAPVV